MAQNIKIVLDNVEKQTPNNVGFSDTITIKGDSKIALTSFNASFDINKQGQDILNQSFIMNLNEALYNSPRTITIPDKTYFSEVDLQLEIYKQLNRAFSAYEKDAPTDQKRVFNGYAITFAKNETESGFGASVKKDKMAIVISAVPLTGMPLDLSEGSGYEDYTLNEDGELTTENEEIDFTQTFNRASIVPGALETENFLIKGGGVSFQYNIRFNLKNQTLTSNVKLLDQNGDYMMLHYNTTERPDAGLGGRFSPSVRFYVTKSVGGVITEDDIPDDKFYYYQLFINQQYQNPNEGPFKQTIPTKTSAYFMWFVRDGKWCILYYDANTSLFNEIYTNGIEYKLQDNYTFSKQIQRPKTEQVIYYSDQTKGTAALGSITGSVTLKTTFNFENAPRLREIYSFGAVGQAQPENTLPAAYVPNGEVDFYPSQDFEIACEIDTIKIKNYVGTKGNKNSGRKNIIAYFTPETSISQSSFIYRFDPSSPIYLAVDSKQDIDFNSLNIRFINTYTNKTFSADTITCVLTNAP